MKNDGFLEKLNTELANAALPMSEKLKNEPICTAGEQPAPQKKFPRRRWFAAGAAALAACVAACVILPNLPKGEEGACMYVDVNPSVAVLLDKDFKVEKVLSENADGDAVLSDGAFASSLLGKSAEEAAKLLAERTAQMGFFDLYANGDDGYNEMTVSFASGKEVAQGKLQSVQSAVTDYFKEKGVYVYVQTASERVSDFQNVAKAMRERSVAWFETAENKRDRALETLYDFAGDILRDSFGRYDLYLQITDAEETARQPLLEKMYYTYGVDYRDYDFADVLEMAAYGASAGLYAEELRPYLTVELSESDFTENLISFAAFATANGYGEELTGAIQTAVTAAIDELFGTAHDFASDMQTLWREYSTSLNTKYKALFDEEREAIGEADYQNFLEKIGKNL